MVQPLLRKILDPLLRVTNQLNINKLIKLLTDRLIGIFTFLLFLKINEIIQSSKFFSVSEGSPSWGSGMVTGIARVCFHNVEPV